MICPMDKRKCMWEVRKTTDDQRNPGKGPGPLLPRSRGCARKGEAKTYISKCQMSFCFSTITVWNVYMILMESFLN